MYKNHACTTTVSEIRAAWRSPTLRTGRKAVVCFNRRPPFSHNLSWYCTAGLWRRVWEAGISKTIVNQSSAIVFFSDRAYQNSIELFIPIVHALRNNLAVLKNILRKWQPPIEAQTIWLRYRKAGILHSAVISLTVGRQALFLYQINRCFTLYRLYKRMYTVRKKFLIWSFFKMFTYLVSY